MNSSNRHLLPRRPRRGTDERPRVRAHVIGQRTRGAYVVKIALLERDGSPPIVSIATFRDELLAGRLEFALGDLELLERACAAARAKASK